MANSLEDLRAAYLQLDDMLNVIEPALTDEELKTFGEVMRKIKTAADTMEDFFYVL